MQRWRGGTGFSLIELALCLSILLIIIPTMVPVFEAFLGDIHEQALRQRILELRRALQVFYLEHARYPGQIFDHYGNNVDFTDDGRSELVNGIHNGFGSYPPNRRTYLPRLPEDPITNKTDWTLLPMDNDGDGIFNEDPEEATTGTYLTGFQTYSAIPSRMYRALTSTTIALDDFIQFDNDHDGKIDEDPIDVGDVRSRATGYESL